MPTEQKQDRPITLDERLSLIESAIGELYGRQERLEKSIPGKVMVSINRNLRDLNNLRDDTITKLRQLREFMNSIRGRDGSN